MVFEIAVIIMSALITIVALGIIVLAAWACLKALWGIYGLIGYGLDCLVSWVSGGDPPSFDAYWSEHWRAWRDFWADGGEADYYAAA